jgi:hypothetical protein
MSHKLIMGSDLYKGFKLDKSTLLGGAIDDILPFQMMTLDEKTPDWIHAVADYYETAGWNNVEKKAGRIQKNFWMRQGKLDQSDYIINPEINPVSQAIGMIVPPESQSPLEQFYPLAPNFVDVLRGEFIKRDNTWNVRAQDPYSKNQAFKNKTDQFQELVMQAALIEKQQAMARLGITQESNPQEYQQQLQELQQRMATVEQEARNFRTEGEKWANKVIKIHDERYNLLEVEPDAFECGLICDRQFWHLDLLDDDFKLELLNPKWADYHKAPGHKYVSDGDYFLWFDFMSSGDIVNKYGRRMKEEDILKLKDIYVKTANLIVPDYLKARQGAYYDMSKPWAEATDLNPAMNDAMLGKELAYNFMRSPNFDHNQDVDILNPVWGRLTTGHPQMFRVMNLYWRTLRRIGWLTKINRDGSKVPPVWVDENFKVTEEPVYDKSVIKDETKDNLLYGEHIDWTWGPEWRRVIKISPNQKHTFWLNSQNQMEAIYLDGGPVKFQFKGVNNPFDCLPPVEGCEFSYFNAGPHSFIDRVKSLQILYNICMNKVPKKFLNDYGNKIAINRMTMRNNSLDAQTSGMDDIEAYEEKLMNSPFIDYTMDRESLAGGIGQPALPTVLQLSTIQEAQLYFSLGQNIKWEAGELIGITRQRQGAGKVSETAQANEQAITYSETQTEKYFEQHSHLMKRVRQRMLDATQYYSTFNESNRDIYMTEDNEVIFLEIAGMENTLPHYNITLESKANIRAALQKISNYLQNNNTLAIKPSAYIGAIVENSLPKLLNLVKEGELEQEQREQAQRDHELQLEQERRKTLLAQQQATNDQRDKEKQADYVRETDVAEIRAMGGMQTDVNANGETDALEGVETIIKQQEMENDNRNKQNEINTKAVAEDKKNQTELQKAAMKLAGDKYKADKTLEVAKENRTAAEMKKKATAKKAKKK